MSLAELFTDCLRREKRALPGLRQTEAEKAADLDLYRRLQRLDKQQEERK